MEEQSDSLIFFAIGDWGDRYNTNKLALVMNSFISENENFKPSFILSLGDNFYPSGVSGVQDPVWKEMWEEPFLKYPNLRVPWRAVLGNHDYQTDPDAQIEFTRCSHNPGKLWYLPSRVYKFTESASKCSIDFFAIDTNGAQGHVRRDYKKLNMAQELWVYREWLSNELKNSTSQWKIVFAHHPLYTKGTHHGTIARCIRDETYTHRAGVSKGYDLEKVLIQGGVNLYISGHEHVSQQKVANGINYCVVFSGGADVGFYGKEDRNVEMDWWKIVPTFLVVTVTSDELCIRFISTHTTECIHIVRIPKVEI